MATTQIRSLQALDANRCGPSAQPSADRFQRCHSSAAGAGAEAAAALDLRAGAALSAAAPCSGGKAGTSAKVGGIVANCKLDPKADAMLHLVIADIGAGTDAMAGKDPKTRPALGLVRVAQAVR